MAAFHAAARDYRFWAANESVMLGRNRVERLHSAVLGGMLFVGPKLETKLHLRVNESRAFEHHFGKIITTVQVRMVYADSLGKSIG